MRSGRANSSLAPPAPGAPPGGIRLSRQELADGSGRKAPESVARSVKKPSGGAPFGAGVPRQDAGRRSQGAPPVPRRAREPASRKKRARRTALHSPRGAGRRTERPAEPAPDAIPGPAKRWLHDDLQRGDNARAMGASKRRTPASQRPGNGERACNRRTFARGGRCAFITRRHI
jgi:hypothetical protein